MQTLNHLNDYRAIEFRRYIIKDGEREHFSQYFDSYFPEAFQQLGAIAHGEFYERDDPSRFTWIRAFHTIEDRAVVNSAFYYGAVWREHKATVNNLMLDSDNVLLLRPLSPATNIPVLPAVDPVFEEKGAQGIVIAEIFAVKTGEAEAFAKQAESIFAHYQIAGIRPAGILVTLDVPNNFPQLPVRTDGPYLVYLGIIKDNQTLEEKFKPLAEHSLRSLTATDLLRGAPELIIMDPTQRSRLRWLVEWQQ